MIICAAIKDTRTGAVFGGIRHGDIYFAMLNLKILSNILKNEKEMLFDGDMQ